MLAAAVVLVVAGATLGVYAVAGRARPARSQGGGAPFAASQLPRCRSTQLRLAPPRWEFGGGQLIASLTLTNTSGASCAVGGWPAVRRLDGAGHAIPTSIGRSVYTQSGSTPFRMVALRPGAEASFSVEGGRFNWRANRGCRTARTIAVEPRGGGAWLSAAVHLPACRRWNVGPLVPRRFAAPPTFGLGQFYFPPTSAQPFYSGRENGLRWKLRVRDSGDGRYCFRLFVDDALRAAKCGRFYGPGVAGKLGFVSRSRSPSFVVGAVLVRARAVEITLTNNRYREIEAMPPTRVLAPGIAFFFSTIPQGTAPVSIVADSQQGTHVVTWHRP